MANDFSTGKSIFILAIVAGCFAVLWPNVFYPMLQGTFSQKDTLATTQEHLRQERPPHLRPEFLHPALREKGRAIPQSRTPAKQPPPEVRSGTPLPGMRPPMGGPGQVVPPPKGGGTMGIVMPMYTIGIIVFFLYTMMKLLFKKTESSEAYENFTSDPHFQKTVLKDNYSAIQEVSEDGSKIVITAISGLVEEVNRQLRSDQGQQTDENKQDEKTAGKVSTDKDCYVKENTEETLLKETNKDACKEEDTSETDISSEPTDDGKSVVKVLGMETTETCERGAKWSRPPTPLSRPSTPLSRPSTPLSRPSTPQNIFIPGSLPSKSQLLVSDSHIETVDNQDNAVVLTGKVTLSLIGLSENNSPVEEGKKQLPNTETSHKNREPNGTCATPLSGNNKAEVSKLEAEEILDGHEDDK